MRSLIDEADVLSAPGSRQASVAAVALAPANTAAEAVSVAVRRACVDCDAVTGFIGVEEAVQEC